MEWISVEDRLPDIGQIVLAALKNPYKTLNYPYEEQVLILYRVKYNYVTETKIKWQKPFAGDTVNYNDRVAFWTPIPQLPDIIKDNPLIVEL